VYLAWCLLVLLILEKAFTINEKNEPVWTDLHLRQI